jgi:hypothetical protein
MAERFSTPDDFGEIKASDLYRVEKAKMITDAHAFLVPLIWLAVAIVLLLVVRMLKGGRLFRMVGLWLDAKERELSRRASRFEPRPEQGQDQHNHERKS